MPSSDSTRNRPQGETSTTTTATSATSLTPRAVRRGLALKASSRIRSLPISGMPANDERVGEIIQYGRSKMPAYGRELDQQQIQDLLAYMHTL